MFITDLMLLIDSQVKNYTFDAYHALVSAHLGSIKLILVLYFTFLGYRLLMAKQQFSYQNFLEHVLLISCGYFAATQWGIFSLFIYDLAMALPNELSVTLVSVVPNIPQQADGVELLEYLWFSGLDIAATLWGSISISAIHQGLMALGVLLMTLLLVGYGLIVISLAKMILAIGFALAPLFILLYLFKPSESLFIGWLRVIFTVMMKQIIIFAMIALVYSISFDTVEALKLQTTLDMVDVSSFLLLLLISLGLFFSAHSMAVTIGESLSVSATYCANKSRTYIQQHLKDMQAHHERLF
jgi:type IV secretion system protein VirB6